MSTKSTAINEALTTEKFSILDVMKHWLRLCYAVKRLLKFGTKKI